MYEAAIKLSTNMQALAGAFEEIMGEYAGQKVSFVLIAHVDSAVNFASNLPRDAAAELVSDTYTELTGKPLTPAHINPVLIGQRLADVEYLSWFPTQKGN